MKPKPTPPRPLLEGFPNEIRGAGPQPEDFADFDEWVFARKMWFAAQMEPLRTRPRNSNAKRFPSSNPKPCGTNPAPSWTNPELK